MKKIFYVLLIMSFLVLTNFSTMVGSASNINQLDIIPSANIDGKLISNGTAIVRVDDEGDSDRCELWIDGSLYTYMNEIGSGGAGSFNWRYALNTRGFSDGAHTIQVRSKNGTGGNDVKARQVWFDNTGPQLENITVNYQNGFEAAKNNSNIYVRAQITDDIAGIENVSVNASSIGADTIQMYDDGSHQDGGPNDGIYGTVPFTVQANTSYRYINITTRDRLGNSKEESLEVKIDNYAPTIRGIKTNMPPGQSAVKKGDEIQVVADARDLKMEYETVTTRIPTDIVLVIDNSGSMGDDPNGDGETKLDDAKQAARSFIGQLNPEDRVALYVFSNQTSWGVEAPRRVEDYMNMTQGNKDEMNGTIDNLGAETGTPIWDTIGNATSYAWNYHETGHVPTVIALTDGDDTVYGGLETGSETYSPGARWSQSGEANRTWNITDNLRWGEQKTYNWELARYQYGSWEGLNWNRDTLDDPTRWGLTGAPLPIFDIGLGVMPQASNSSETGYVDPTATASGEGCSYSFVDPDAYAHNFTTEYDLWKIANSSGGNYYYAPTSSQLSSIYDQISQIIQYKGVNWYGKEAPHGFKEVYLEADELGLSSPVPMFDDGDHDDGNANDNIYGTEPFTVKTGESKSAPIWVKGVDLAGNTNKSYKLISVDNTKPAFNNHTVDYPEGKGFAEDGDNITIKAGVTDNNVRPESVTVDGTEIGGKSEVKLRDNGRGTDQVRNDGVYTSPNITVSTGGSTDDFKLKSTSYQLEISAMDNAGNQIDQGISVVINNTEPPLVPPDFNVLDISPGEIITGTVPIEINASDDDGINDTDNNPRFYLDSGKKIDMQRISGDKNSGVYRGSIQTSQYTDGEHDLSFEVKDSLGATAESSLSITIDNTGPTGDIANPTPGEYIEGQYVFRIVAQDNIELKDVNLSIDDTPYQPGYNAQSGYWEYSMDTDALSDGEHSLNVTAEDTAGHSELIGSQVFNVDNHAPSLGVNSPNEGEVLSGNRTLSVVSQDSVGIARIQYRVDNSVWTNLSGGPPNWTAVLDTTTIDDGDHTLHFISKDEAGHEVTSDLTFTVDNSQPLTYLESPNSQDHIEGVYTFRAGASDEVSVDNVSLTISSGGEENYQMNYNPNTGYWENTLDTDSKTEGRYQASVTVTDSGGNTYTTDWITFYIDNEGPSLSVNTPQEGEIIYGNYTTSVDSEDTVGLSSVEYKVDNTNWINMSGGPPEWSAVLNTSQFYDGTHDIHFRAKDEAGHVTTSDLSITVDNNAPDSYLQSPDSQDFIEGTYTFKAGASDAVEVDEVFLSLAGETNIQHEMGYNPNSGYWEYQKDTSNMEEGVYRANTTVVDTAGHSYTSGSIEFYVDRSAPSLSVNSPQNDEIIHGNYSISVNSSDAVGVSTVEYRIDSTGWISMEKNSSSWRSTLDTDVYQDGEHTFHVRSIDDAGHDISTQFPITIDNTAPSGYLASPEPLEYIEGQYTFKAGASDEVGLNSVILELELSNSTELYPMEYNTHSGYWETTLSTEYMDGARTSQVRVIDMAGHVYVSEDKWFFVDNHAPNLDVKNPDMGEFISGVYELNIWSSDEVAMESVKYSVDNSDWTGLRRGSENNWSGNIDTTLFEDGQHTITVRSEDEAGHVKSQEVEVTIDNSAPDISIVKPLEHQFVEGQLNVKINADDEVGLESVRVDIYSLTSGNDHSHRWCMEATYNPSSGYYEVSLDTTLEKEGGFWNITATAVDRSAKVSRTNTVEFRVDNYLPSLNIAEPRDEDYVSGEVKLNVSTDDAFPGSIEYNVDDSGWVPIVVNLTTTDLAEGPHTIDIRTSDLAGHTVTQSIQVHVDNHEPKAELASPVEGQFIEGWFKFRVSGRDKVGVKEVRIEVFNQTRKISYDSDSGYYLYEMDTRSIEDGNYTFSATVIDNIGHKNSTKTIGFQVDNNDPVVEINHPINGQYINGTIDLNVSAQDRFMKEVKYTVDETGYASLTQKLDTTRLSEGQHTLTVRASDLNDHVTIRKVTVIVDNIAPSLRVIKPLSSEIVSGTQKVEVYAGPDIQNMTLSIPELEEDTEKTMHRLPTGESFQYTLNTSKLSQDKGSGKYDMVVKAKDHAGHTRKKSFSIQVDNLAPSLNKTSPDKKSRGTIRFSTKVEDWSEIKAVKVNIDGKGWNEMMYSGNDTYEYVWETSRDDNGHHTYLIKAVDENGNVKTYSGDVKVDNKPNYWRIFQRNLPGITFLFILILVVFLIFLARAEIKRRIRHRPEDEEKEEQRPEDKGRKKKSSKGLLGDIQNLEFGQKSKAKEKEDKSSKKKDKGFFSGLFSVQSRSKDGEKEKKGEKKHMAKLKKAKKDGPRGKKEETAEGVTPPEQGWKEVELEDDDALREAKEDHTDEVGLEDLQLDSDTIERLKEEKIENLEDLKDIDSERLMDKLDMDREEIDEIIENESSPSKDGLMDSVKNAELPPDEEEK